MDAPTLIFRHTNYKHKPKTEQCRKTNHKYSIINHNYSVHAYLFTKVRLYYNASSTIITNKYKNGFFFFFFCWSLISSEKKNGSCHNYDCF